MALHGPHHSAQKSSRTGVSDLQHLLLEGVVVYMGNQVAHRGSPWLGVKGSGVKNDGAAGIGNTKEPMKRGSFRTVHQATLGAHEA